MNGKLRCRLTVPADIDEAGLKAAALADEQVKKQIAGKQVRKVIVVPGKLVNIVVAWSATLDTNCAGRTCQMAFSRHNPHNRISRATFELQRLLVVKEFITRNAKPVVRRGRKAIGPLAQEVARLPKGWMRCATLGPARPCRSCW